jgi:hypothetical protein
MVRKDMKEFTADMKGIYAAVNRDQTASACCKR